MAEIVADSPSSSLSLPDIIERYRAGESMLSIAKDTPVKARQLYNWLMRDLGHAYYDIQTECLINRYADADVQMHLATDMLQVARAREVCTNTKWVLERRRPQLFAPKQEIKSDTTITVIVQRQTPQPVVGQADMHEVVDITPDGVL